MTVGEGVIWGAGDCGRILTGEETRGGDFDR